MKNFLIISIIIVFIFSSCKSNDNSSDNKDSLNTDYIDTLIDTDTVSNTNNLDSIYENKSDIDEVIATKYICPIGDIEGNQNKAGICPICGMELIENPDYKTE